MNLNHLIGLCSEQEFIVQYMKQVILERKKELYSVFSLVLFKIFNHLFVRKEIIIYFFVTIKTINLILFAEAFELVTSAHRRRRPHYK